MQSARQIRNEWVAIGISLLLTIIIMLALAGAGLAAQGGGALSGAVTDATGARLANVGVQAVNAATNQSQQTTSNDNGEYRFANLPLGKYRVEFTARGFIKKTVQDLTVELAVPARLDAALTVGGLDETVSVMSEGQLLQTENATQAATLTSKELTELPTASRNVTHLIVAEPGVSAPLPDRTGAGLNIATTPGLRQGFQRIDTAEDCRCCPTTPNAPTTIRAPQRRVVRRGRSNTRPNKGQP